MPVPTSGGAGAPPPPLAEGTTAASAPAPAAAAPAYVCIKRVGHAAFAEDAFAEVPCLPGDTVMRLAARACTTFPHWGVGPGQVRLYFALAGGYIAPTPPQIDAILCDESKRLGEGLPLADAGVLQGSWLLARVPLPAAAAVAGAGGGGGGASPPEWAVAMLAPVLEHFRMSELRAKSDGAYDAASAATPDD